MERERGVVPPLGVVPQPFDLGERLVVFHMEDQNIRKKPLEESVSNRVPGLLFFTHPRYARQAHPEVVDSGRRQAFLVHQCCFREPLAFPLVLVQVRRRITSITVTGVDIVDVLSL